MGMMNFMRRLSAVAKIVVPGLFVITLAGCEHVGNYLAFWGNQREMHRAFQEEPSAELLRQLEPDDCFLLTGEVEFAREYAGPVLLVAVTDTFRQREIVVRKILQGPVHFYQAYLPEGEYDLYFLADLNGNDFFDQDEVIGQTTKTPMLVSKERVRDGLTMNGPAIILDTRTPMTTNLPIRMEVRKFDYVFPSLDAEFFDPKYGQMGMYDPMALLSHNQRYIFSLEEFDPRRTLVVFVHGVGGTPRDFKYLVEGLDRSRFQPWFYFYPSGMPLQKVGALLANIFDAAFKVKEYRFNRAIVVAHSMGGLVALSALNQLCSDGAPSYLKGYVSFDSPYGGVEAAKTALEKAPAVVPSWRDVAVGSHFLDRLYQGRAVREIPLFLFFGFKAGDSGDGTIDLKSQLEPRVHFQAYKSYGFNADHVGILNDPAVRQTFNQVLTTIDDQGESTRTVSSGTSRNGEGDALLPLFAVGRQGQK